MKTATATTRKTAAASAGSRSKCLVEVYLTPGQTVVFHRRADPEAQRAATASAIAQMHRRKKRGDVAKVVQDFRNNPRG